MSQHYTALNLTTSATEAEILSAYRKLSLKCHPDKGGDATSFHNLTNAKDYCLKQLELRAQPPLPPTMDYFQFMEQRYGSYNPTTSDSTTRTDPKMTRSLRSRTKPTWAKKLTRAFKARQERRELQKQTEDQQRAREEQLACEEDIMAKARYFTKLQQELREQGVAC